mmetsp:Transcript_3921/g.9817  ORF Transcript_3921/g.9817 Transcript_3921/m.9817 type:complete len:200 (+) Transcript_3921:1280-1879(+)
MDPVVGPHVVRHGQRKLLGEEPLAAEGADGVQGGEEAGRLRHHWARSIEHEPLEVKGHGAVAALQLPKWVHCGHHEDKRGPRQECRAQDTDRDNRAVLNGELEQPWQLEVHERHILGEAVEYPAQRRCVVPNHRLPQHRGQHAAVQLPRDTQEVERGRRDPDKNTECKEQPSRHIESDFPTGCESIADASLARSGGPNA